MMQQDRKLAIVRKRARG